LSKSARIATFRERAVIPATCSDAATMSASRVTATIEALGLCALGAYESAARFDRTAR
jgi:hypothetical protein